MWAAIGTWDFAMPGIEIAARMLNGGATAMDAAVEIAACVEDDPQVNTVGCGGFPNRAGEVELDAAVMDGKTLALGAVAGMKGYRNPIRIARDILFHSRHNMLVGQGAEMFAKQLGYERAVLLTDAARQKWEAEMAKGDVEPFGHDTVGVVTLAADGRMCAGTSTSGVGLKEPGRVGDSPLIGSGFYVDDECGGACATGWGEDIMKCCASFWAVECMRAGLTAREAAERAVARMHDRLLKNGSNPGNIAVICMDRHGDFGGAANHEGFSYAAATNSHAPRLYEVVPLVRRKSSGTKLETLNNIYR